MSVEDESKISDHETLRIDLFDNSEPVDDFLTIKCWKKYTKDALLTILREKYQNESPRLIDEKADILGTILKESVNKLVVIKTIKCRSRKKWYSLELKNLQL